MYEIEGQRVHDRAWEPAADRVPPFALYLVRELRGGFCETLTKMSRESVVKFWNGFSSQRSLWMVVQYDTAE